MRTLIQMSLTGGISICAVMLFRALFQNRVRRGTFLLLWGAVLLQLLLPVTISAPTSVYNLPVFPQEQQAAPVSEEVPAMPEPSGEVPVSTHSPEPEESFRSPETIASAVWLTGALGCMCFFLGSHISARRRYRFSVPAPGLEAPRGIRIRMLDGLISPLTYGIVKPVVLLPPELVRQGGPGLSCIVRHELTHIRHHDVAKKLLLLLAVSVHWFNPLVWLMLYLASQDLEMHCDESVVKVMSKEESLLYAKTLVSMEESKLLSYLQAGFSLSSTGSRLKALVKSRVHPILGRVLSCILCATLLLCFLPGQLPDTAAAPKPSALPATAPSTSPASEPSMQSPPTLPLPTEEETVPSQAIPPTVPSEKPLPTELLPTEPPQTEPPSTEPPETRPPETTPQATTQEPEATEEIPQEWLDRISPQYGANIRLNTPGTMTMTVGESTSFRVTCEYPVDFFVDDPSMVHADSFGTDSNKYVCSLSAVKAGTVNLYYQVWYGGEPHLYAAITILPNGDTTEVDFSEVGNTPTDPLPQPEPTDPSEPEIEIKLPGG